MSERFYQFILRLIFSRLVRHRRTDHSSGDVEYSARLGPFLLGVCIAFVCDHRDATVALRSSRLGIEVGFRVCLGREPARPAGFYFWRRPPPRPRGDQPFPFQAGNGRPFLSISPQSIQGEHDDGKQRFDNPF